ncbi:alpha/beta fold hydrolase [Paenibacillus physcomitrellae]|uniref:Alpha/beta hydrolase n=1 Tax=Paenibacillus physcomitrellae TaxID=1619311 RepID=A0ABQ1FSQ2_9BACL|nr:alpha/beta hydrolase [Paenibacillus physcomitrellae]GGA28199.1 alpha/beta hydrolase [Paenibacillus physcomitrellae]
MNLPNAPVVTGIVTTEGDTLYYEIRGSGQPLLLIPSEGDAGCYENVAPLLAEHYQVITYDRRGHSRSTRNEPDRFDIGRQARDAVAVLKAAGHDSALVFGSGDGGVIALEMIKSQPQAIQAAVIHEPPVIRLLPDSKRWRYFFGGVSRTAEIHGVNEAMFMLSLSLKLPPQAQTRIPQAYKERIAGNAGFYVNHELTPLVHYKPNAELLLASGVPLRLAASQQTLDNDLYYGQTSKVLAEALGSEPAVLPGHHLSFFDMPEEWAAALLEILPVE